MAREAIFIGYRRDDTADVAGRIYDALARRFGKERIFKDVDSLRPGADFGEYITTVLPGCRVALILIAPTWIDSRDESGQRRLDDPHDWVRVEIETALATPHLDVVPVLVNGARMPRAEELPPSLHPLLRRHAAVVRRDPDFHEDIGRLVNALSLSVRTGILDLASLGGGRKAAASGATFEGRSVPMMALIAVVVLALATLGFAAWRWTAPLFGQTVETNVHEPAPIQTIDHAADSETDSEAADISIGSSSQLEAEAQPTPQAPLQPTTDRSPTGYHLPNAPTSDDYCDMLVVVANAASTGFSTWKLEPPRTVQGGVIWRSNFQLPGAMGCNVQQSTSENSSVAFACNWYTPSPEDALREVERMRTAFLACPGAVPGLAGDPVIGGARFGVSITDPVPNQTRVIVMQSY